MKSAIKKAFAAKLGISPQQLSNWLAEGMPKPPDIKGANDWIRKNKAQRGKAMDRPAPPGPLIQVEDSGDSWESRVIRAKQTERETHKAYLDALASGEALKLEKLLSCHSRAVQAVGEAETLANKVQIDTKQLLRADDVRAIMREVALPLKARIESLPLQERGHCNPANPEIAELALREWVQRTLVMVSTMATSFK
jgi:hypothetical protein